MCCFTWHTRLLSRTAKRPRRQTLRGTVLANQLVSEQLVRSVLARHPTRSDLDALEGLHATLEPVSSDLVRDWAVGACVVVATSTEALFY